MSDVLPGPGAKRRPVSGKEGAMARRPAVTVLGSLNTDISLPVPHLPGPGETVLAAAAATFGAGGKGANQAVAAARLGAAARMVGCCGDDEFGARLRAGLEAEGIGVAGLRAIPGVASGLALITVDPAGENSIAVAAGANGLAGAAEVAAAFAEPCDVLVLSAEIPAPVLGAALRRARAHGVRTVLNLAPVPDGAAGLLAECPDWLVVNAQEAAALAGRAPEGMPGDAPGGPGAEDGAAEDGAAPDGAAGDDGGARVPCNRRGHRGRRGRVRRGPGRRAGQRPAPGRRGHRRLRGRCGGGHPPGSAGGPAPARRRARGDRVLLARLTALAVRPGWRSGRAGGPAGRVGGPAERAGRLAS